MTSESRSGAHAAGRLRDFLSEEAEAVTSSLVFAAPGPGCVYALSHVDSPSWAGLPHCWTISLLFILAPRTLRVCIRGETEAPREKELVHPGRLEQSRPSAQR